MSRRADPERIYLTRRATILMRLTTSGVSEERAEPLVREWEADLESRGVARLEAAFWENASGWTMGRAWPNKGQSRRSSVAFGEVPATV